MESIFDDKLISSVREKIKGKNKVVIVPEGNEDRVIKSLALTPDIVKKLVGNKEEIEEKIKKEYGNDFDSIMEMVEIVDESNFQTEERIKALIEKRKNKIDHHAAKELLSNRNYVATMMLDCNKADALVGGAEYSTADILRPAFQIIKPKQGSKIVSSFFIMQKEGKMILFADCAVNLKPNAEELKDIAIQTYDSAKELGMDPKVALLSYSTKGSGMGEDVDKVREAYQLLIDERPDLKDCIDGEFQFDAAYDAAVGKIKAPYSEVVGKANVFVFPSLEAGNIGYKIAQFMGGWSAVGPLLQGLNKPVNDLSRGTTPETIAKVMYLSLR